MAQRQAHLRFEPALLLPFAAAAWDAVARRHAWREGVLAAAAPLDRDAFLVMGAIDADTVRKMAAIAPRAHLALSPANPADAREARALIAALPNASLIEAGAPTLSRRFRDWAPTKIVALDPVQDRPERAAAAHFAGLASILRDDGAIVVTHRLTAQALDRPAVMRALRAAGFIAVDEYEVFTTMTGSVALFRARKR